MHEVTIKNVHIFGRHKLITFGVIIAGILLAIFVVLLMKGSVTSPGQHSKATGNLVQDEPWRMAGASVNGNQIDIRYTGLAIVKQDGSPGYDNPPVNYGFSLNTPESFIVTTKIATHDNPLNMSLYGALPIVGDEYRAEQGSLVLALNGDRSSAQLSEQPDGNAAGRVDFSYKPQTQDTIQLAVSNNTVNITINNQQVASLSNKRIFNGQLWFGFSELSENGDATVMELSAKAQNGSSITSSQPSAIIIKPDKKGLSSLAVRKRSGFIFGTAVATNPLVSDQVYQNLLANFNSFTTENAMKFQTIHPLPGNQTTSYNFSEADTIVDIAQNSAISVHGHALIFGEANPAWLQNLAVTNPDQMKPTMIDHITTLMTRYKDKVANWDVVNEPLAAQSNNLRNNIWYKAIGPDYIASALTAARNADPKAGLWINEFGMESDDERFAAMLTIVQQLQAQNIPLTGIGFQAHIDSGDTTDNDTHIDIAKLKSRFAALEKVGLKARVSELDISNDSEYAVFADVTKACIESPNCTGVTTWGPTDKYGALDITNKGVISTNIGLLWGDTGQPTDGATALQDYFNNGSY